jgi:5'(3')-deoxyribonucleotidase
MERKDILLDVDEVVCFSGFLEAVNDFLGTSYTLEDFKDYYIDEAAVPKSQFDEFTRFVSSRNRYKDATLLPGSVESIQKLNEVYNIFICSSCINPFDKPGSGRLFNDKYNFLINTLPFLRPERFIFTDAKELISADIMIDDRLKHLLNNRHVTTRILFPSYHNKEISNQELSEHGIVRAGFDYHNGWQEVENILLNPKVYVKK